jgi:hypothetical protein
MMSLNENDNANKTLVEEENNSNFTTAVEKVVADFVAKLWKGNFGLAMTYWVYGVLGGIVWSVSILALNAEKESDLEKFIFFLMGAYYFVIYVGIWQSANKFTGSKVWAVLAKFVVVIVVLPTAIKLIKWLLSD